ncbi:MAG: hypothetical protein HN560_02945 [Anaerolineae bacterium]|jgi:hypothetical protein|nr:hypothetical protein [Anaerolineae bacterium]
MKIKSPLANITNILGQIRDSAELYKETLHSNESATRSVLIDPLLRALGWDTANPFMVEIEKTIDKGRVDYALLDINQDIKVIIEAKKLGAALSDKEIFLALVKYAFSAGVSDIFLTDGLYWLHYTNFSPGNQEPSKKLFVKDDDLVEIAAYFVQRIDAARYWPEQKDVDDLSESINQLQSQISAIQLELAKTKKEREPSTVVEKKSSAIQTKVENMTTLAKIGNVARTKPSELLLPDNTIVPVNTWADVLSQICMFTMANNPNMNIPLKDAAGKKVELIRLSRPPRGISFFETIYQGNKVFVYTNYDSNNCIRNSLHLLEQLPEKLIDVQASVRYS